MSRKLIWILELSVLVLGGGVSFFHIHNSDVWWHIAWGEEMLREHTIFPSADLFYFTPTTTHYLRELPNTFLGDIALALLMRAGGVVALELLVFFSLLGGAYFLLFLPWYNRLKQDPRWISLGYLLFVFFCLGTSQLQIVRNSIISLAFFPLTLLLYIEQKDEKNHKIFFLYPLLFLCWSWIHPSYFLGMISLFLLYGGEVLHWIVKKSQKRNFSFPISTTRMLLILLTIFLFTLTYSWQPRQLLTAGVRNAASFITHFENAKSLSGPDSQNMLSQITQPIWVNKQIPLSGDFLPTWRVLHHPAAWCSLLLALLAWIALLLFPTPYKWGMTTLLLLTTYFGICYFRGTGYLAIASIFILVSTIPDMHYWPRALLKIIPPACALIAFLLSLSILGFIASHQSEFFFKEKGRIVGIGKAAVFSEEVYQFAEQFFPSAPCFTTIVTGSYASFFWQKKKKVFIDGFFAPHPTSLWQDYNALTQSEENTLLDRYNVQIALVENSRFDWQNRFLNALGWRPIALGKGVTLYGKENLISPETPLQILFDSSEVQALAPTERQALAAAYYNSILILQLHHFSKAALESVNQNPILFSTLVSFLDPSQRGNILFDPPSIKPCLLMP